MDRWYAARRVRVGPAGRSRTERLQGQPGEGFADVGGVMAWLEERGDVVRVDDADGSFFRGWGDPFCAVAGSRNDPWEQGPQLGLGE